jgi:hypothetical protein
MITFYTGPVYQAVGRYWDTGSVIVRETFGR